MNGRETAGRTLAAAADSAVVSVAGRTHSSGVEENGNVKSLKKSLLTRGVESRMAEVTRPS